MKRSFVLAAFAAALCACTASTPPPAERVGETAGPALTAKTEAPAAAAPASARACGVEKNDHGRGYDSAARACLWDAYEQGTAASLTIVMTTIEGDPISFTISAQSRDSVDVTRASQDRFGAQGKSTTHCTSLVREAVEGTERSRFVAKGCSGDQAEIGVP